VARRVFLHIGTMKSATTYIQTLCHRNADRLVAQGILCPPLGANFAAINVLLGSGYIRPWNQGAWQQLSDAISSHDGDVFISNEILSLRSRRKVAQLVRALAPAEVLVLLTARDLARVIPSQWQEGAVNQQTVTWSDFAGSVCADEPHDSGIADRFWRRHDLPSILDRWAHSVPVDRMTLVTVPAGGAPGVLAQRCGAALDADFSDFDEPAVRHTSLGAHSAELMRRLNVASGEVDTLRYRTGFHKSLSRGVLAARARSEPRIALSSDQHEWARRRAQAMVEDVERKGVRVIGDLAELVPPPYTEGSGIDPAEASDADLLAAAVAGLVGVTLELADVRVAYDAHRRRGGVDGPDSEEL
jgi:hypothetical protein